MAAGIANGFHVRRLKMVSTMESTVVTAPDCNSWLPN